MTFKEALDKVDRCYRKWGLPGVAVAGDAGTEWIFQARSSGTGGGEEPDLPEPIIISKDTGGMRYCLIQDRNDRDKMYAAEKAIIYQTK